jgi:hypothetical protein
MRLARIATLVAAVFALSGCASVQVAAYCPRDVPVARGTAGLYGTVWDDVNHPVPNATVLVDETSSVTTTDGLGTFVITGLPPGNVTVIVSEPKHEAAPQPVHLDVDDCSSIFIRADRLHNR